MSRLICIAGLAVCASVLPVTAGLPDTLDYDAIRAVPALYDGRWQPFDTVARDVVEEVTGTPRLGRHDAVAVFLGWTFDPVTWQDEPLIKVSSAELRRELELPADKKVYSYSELVDHERLKTLMNKLRMVSGRKLDPLESKVSDIRKKLELLHMCFLGEVFCPIPNATDALGEWEPIRFPESSDDEVDTVTKAWIEVGQCYLKDDAAGFSTASRQLAKALAALPAAHRPTAELIEKELHYNRLGTWSGAWHIWTVGAGLAALSLLVRWRPFDFLVVVAMAAGFCVLSYGLWLRWHIAGRIPASNMFESLLFLSWGVGIFTILAVVFQRNRLVPLVASVTGALALALADKLPLDSYIRPIVPVLHDTIWMSIHVPIIMVSYYMLALAMILAHIQLGVTALSRSGSNAPKELDRLHYLCIYAGSVLLFVGIATGSMWGASSWGRYWGWDPKEVWSLIAFVGYMAILHVRIDHSRIPDWAYWVGGLVMCVLLARVFSYLKPEVVSWATVWPRLVGLVGATAGTIVFLLSRSPFGTAVKSIAAFWMILMTYLGVNYVLGSGLHSYGFGTGAMVRWMMLIGAVDLAFIAVFSIAYRMRTRAAPAVAKAR